MAEANALARLEDGRLAISGALSASDVIVLWGQLQRSRYTLLDLHGVSDADSAALAMLSRLQENNPEAVVSGLPVHLDALRQAYRLDPHLRFTA